MKVAQFISSMDDGGAESMVMSLSKSLDFGHQVEVITFGNPHIQTACEKAAAEGYRLKHITVPDHIARWQSIKTLPIFAWKFGKWLKLRNVSLLHSHLYKASLMGGLASYMHGIPHVATQHDVYTLVEKPSRGKWLRCMSKIGTSLVVISENMRISYQDKCKLDYKDLNLIYNGVDIKEFMPQTKSYEAPDITFVGVGRFEKIKGFDVMIKVFANFNHQYPNTTLLLVGDGPERKNLEELAKTLHVEKRILFLGRKSNIPNILRSADCFVMTSHSEGLSMSIIEAMSCGLPIIATDVGGNHELVTDGVNGYLPSNLDFHGKVNALKKFMELSIDKKQDMGHNSRRLAVSRFSLLEMSTQYERLYRRVSC